MDISNPRRVLAVSKPDQGLLDLLQGLTGSQPTLTGDTIAGLTHNYTIKTTYYTATIPIWLDEITSPSVWATEFLAPEAREVLTVLGAFIVCFKSPVTQADLSEIKALLESVAEVIKDGCGLTWDGVCLAVAMPQSTTPKLEMSGEEWEDLCQEFGFEFIDFKGKGKNQYSEPLGMDRLKEALETNEWEGNDLGDALGPEDFEDEEGSGTGFSAEAAELNIEMFGVQQAIHDIGEDDEVVDQDEEVEKLQAMMQKMQAVRDMGADMPENERKRFAAKAVNDIMKTF